MKVAKGILGIVIIVLSCMVLRIIDPESIADWQTRLFAFCSLIYGMGAVFFNLGDMIVDFVDMRKDDRSRLDS